VKTQTITISIKKPIPEAVKPNIRKIFRFQPGDLNKLYSAIERDLSGQHDKESKDLKIRVGKLLRRYRQQQNLTAQEFCDNTGIEGTNLILAERGLLSDEEFTNTLSVIDDELGISLAALYLELKEM